MPLVVDASVALAWALPDENSAYADSVLAAVEQDGLLVPALWASEIANGLAMANRRKRITSADEQAFLFALSHLNIEVEKALSLIEAIRRGTAVSLRFGLTAYDAVHVDLAARKSLTLATLHIAMRKAANKQEFGSSPKLSRRRIMRAPPLPTHPTPRRPPPPSP